MHIDGVSDIRKENLMIRVACNRDLTGEIAAVVISSGAQLKSLNKREYGLDDIYYRYFEGGDNND
jgi:ABC-2 type transport system ATP-binding protein